MTDRFRKHQSRRRWIVRLALLVAVFTMWRLLGPGIIVIRTESLFPLLQPGDVVFARRGTRDLVAGDTVSIRAPLADNFEVSGLIDRLRRDTTDDIGDEASLHRAAQPPFVPRVVIAVSGDQVTWNDQTVVVRSDGAAHRYSLPPLHPRLNSPTRQRQLQDGELFLVSLRSGRIDSRVLGPVVTTDTRFVLRQILWPANRRAPVRGALYLREETRSSSE